MSDVKLDARFAGRGGTEDGVSVRLVQSDEAQRLLPGMFNEVQVGRPGMYSRSEVWWTNRIFSDPERYRDGASSARYAVAEADGDPIGYVSYRQKSSWDTLAAGEIRIRELIPVTDAGYRALWHYLVSIDLFPIVKYWNNPVDDPLPFLLRDGRAAETKTQDALWSRLIDVPAALEARRYERDGSIVVRVADTFCDWNEGTYRITVDGGAAKCEPVVAEPDVSLPVGTLGALYMGGNSAVSLARAGLLDGNSESVHTLDGVFRNSVAPWCHEIF
jgi:predicted acetyltransferase